MLSFALATPVHREVMARQMHLLRSYVLTNMRMPCTHRLTLPRKERTDDNEKNAIRQ
jgi:hypothetical protein